MNNGQRPWLGEEGMAASRLENEGAFTEVATSWRYSVFLAVYLSVAIPYLMWRLDLLLSQGLWYLIVLFVIELYTMLTTLLHLGLTRRLLHPVWTPPLAGRTVDAFIPTYNESTDIVEMTAIAAMRIQGIRHVFVLDDGARPEIRDLAERIGARYVTRTNNLHAKAGNMNVGLQHSDAEFVIFLDCDHVPQPQFIQRTLGYFRDDKLAFVQTPQCFYNFQSSIQFRKLPFRNLWNEQTMFYEYIQPAKNAFNAAFFCGSGAILRRAALDSVGGFATGTATEDIHTSIRLHANGWRSVFLHEVLAYGIAAEDFKEYHAQRVRWGAGSLGLLFRTSDSPLLKRGLTPMQRLAYFSSTNGYLYGGIIKLLYLAVPVFVLFTVPFMGSSTNASVVRYLVAAVPFSVLSILVTYVYSRRTFHPLYSEQFNIANILACLMALKGVFKVQKKFRVSVKKKRGKEFSVAYTFILVMAALMAGANIFLVAHWCIVMGGSFSQLPSPATLLAFFWNTYNLVFVLSLVIFLHRFHHRPSREHAFHPRHTPVVLATGEAGSVQSVGFKGAVIGSGNYPETSVLRFALHASTQVISLVGNVVDRDVRDGQNWTTVAFRELSLAQKNHLLQYVFNDIVNPAFSQDYAVGKRSHRWRRIMCVIAAVPTLVSAASLAVRRWVRSCVTTPKGMVAGAGFAGAALNGISWPRPSAANQGLGAMEHHVTAIAAGQHGRQSAIARPDVTDDAVVPIGPGQWGRGEDALRQTLARHDDETAHLRAQLNDQAIVLDRVRRALFLAVDTLPPSAGEVPREARAQIVDDYPEPAVHVSTPEPVERPGRTSRWAIVRRHIPRGLADVRTLGWPQPRHRRRSAWRWR